MKALDGKGTGWCIAGESTAEGYLKNGTNIKSKISYLLNEIHENISISDFYFTTYVN